MLGRLIGNQTFRNKLLETQLVFSLWPSSGRLDLYHEDKMLFERME
jgi:hypothetical protein